jgi:hypothetical protein
VVSQAGAPGATADDASEREYTLDDLAFAAGVPSRTIRFYQFEGVLPAPVRRGRVALYDGKHMARLRLIGELKDLVQPWSDDRPATIGHAELAQIVGDERPGTIASLVEFGVVEREDGGAGVAYRIPSPGLLRTTLALQQSGVDIETAARAGGILRRHLGAAARDLVDHFARRAGRGFGSRTAPATIGPALDALRPFAGDAASLIFAREIERALRERFASRGSRRSSHRSRPRVRLRSGRIR